MENKLVQVCEKYAMNIKSIGTTAFSQKATSAKYRGMMEIHSRKDDCLNYVGPAGRWTLEEALKWWKEKHGGK